MVILYLQNFEFARQRIANINKSAAGMHDTPPRKFNLAKMFVNKFSRYKRAEQNFVINEGP